MPDRARSATANALRVSFRLSVTGMDSARASLPKHREVAEAICARDAFAARAALTTLIEAAYQDILRALPETRPEDAHRVEVARLADQKP